jgi:Leucine-rich repeat (LRR) protein
MTRILNYFLCLSFLSCFSLIQAEADTDSPESTTQDAENSASPEQESSTQDAAESADALEKKEAMIIDARRLAATFKDTILNIKGHPDEKFQLMNVTINFGDTLSQLHSLKEEQVLDRFDKISFVMTDKDHMTLDEAVFINSILPLLGHIKVLELECWGVSDKVVGAIAANCPHLTKLYLFGPSITDSTMDVLVEKLPNLKKLHLINTNLTEKGASKIDDTFKNLYTLGMSGKKLEDEDLVVVVKGMANLHTLSVSGQTFKDVKNIDLLIKAAPKLKDFDLSDTNIADGSIKTIIDTMKNLNSLNISNTTLGKDSVKEAIENLDLKTLIIDGVKGVDDDELKLISEHQQKLEKLHFSGADFTNFGIMDIIQNLPELQDLMLAPTAQSKWILTDAVVAAMAFHLKKLKYLRIEGARLPDDLRKWIAENMPDTNIEYV